jgi:hypothetical protein
LGLERYKETTEPFKKAVQTNPMDIHALFIFSKSHFTDLQFDNKSKGGISCIYPFDTCNNAIEFNGWQFLDKSVFGFLTGYPV